jgi:hypothetical protein
LVWSVAAIWDVRFLPLLQPFSRDIWCTIHGFSLRFARDECRTMRPDGSVPAQPRGVYSGGDHNRKSERFRSRFFEAMPRGSIVVLVSRAGVVHWDDLLDAAASGHIRAAIDVFPDEPIAHDARVRDTPNTILSAHRAGNVPEVWTQMGEMVVDDLEWILRGLPPQRMQRATQGIVSRLRSKPVG